MLKIIHNASIKFDETYDPVSDDTIITLFADIIFAPWITIENLTYQGSAGSGKLVYSSDGIRKNPLGIRLGIDSKFNRQLSWGYGIESGFRPGIKGQGFFLQGRVSFPVVGFLAANRNVPPE